MRNHLRTTYSAPFLAMALGLAACLAAPWSAAAESDPQIRIRPAERYPAADLQAVMAVAHAGERIVTVGAHGIVRLSEDGGKTFHQAAAVPVQSTLTGVSFADPDHGWAVGQWGVVIATADGGETWQLQRSDISVDRPLFSVYFKNDKEGWAVGLWSLLLATRDGGLTWAEVKVPAPPGASKADLNLYGIVQTKSGALVIAGEQGKLLRSEDEGQSWVYVDTGYKGTFWTGIRLDSGTLLVGGLRGTIYRSVDDGRHWQPAKTDGPSSITGFLQGADGTVTGVGLDGLSVTSGDDGASFVAHQRDDRAAITAIVRSAGKGPLLFSKTGLLGESK